MNNQEKILNIIKRKKKASGRDLIAELGFSRAYVNKVLNELIREGLVARLGQTNQTHYKLAGDKTPAGEKSAAFRKTYKRARASEDGVLAQINMETNILNNLSERVVSLFNYGLTEMVNNALDHSGSDKIKVIAGCRQNTLLFGVDDLGMGIFEHIRKKKDCRIIGRRCRT